MHPGLKKGAKLLVLFSFSIFNHINNLNTLVKTSRASITLFKAVVTFRYLYS
uniref:Uncharacterized protein n=1 Tax=Anguilla anguilla TaxID=7936 RepID=A0A0E9QYS9_ANGAN